KIWHNYFKHLPKLNRYSLGVKIDDSFLELIEELNDVIYSPREQRSAVIKIVSKKLDLLKLFLKIGWEVELLENKQYAVVSIPLAEIGKRIGGWEKQII
ncbi:MAG: four helix bundle protein, partial [bacterium]|nr:four helix bundle protein [bacterium]